MTVRVKVRSKEKNMEKKLARFTLADLDLSKRRPLDPRQIESPEGVPFFGGTFQWIPGDPDPLERRLF